LKKFKFSLQKILEIKEQLLDNCKAELNRINNEIRTLDDDIKVLKIRFSEIDNEFTDKSSRSISVGELTYYKVLMSSVLKNIENKEDEKQALFKKAEAKRQEIINMNMEISSLEKLRENELAKYNKALQKSEEIFIDEFVSNKSMSKEYAI
jgi:flagellar FliJ protein